MGFLLFAFRKLSLKRTISQKEFRQAQIGTRILELQDQQSIMSQAKSSAQNAISMFVNANLSLCDNVFQTKYYELSNGASKQSQNYKKILAQYDGDATNAEVVKAYDDLTNYQAEASKKYQALMADFQAAQSGVRMSEQSMNSIFSASDKTQQENLHRQETQLEQENAGLDSQLKELREQLSGVEKAEDQAAKDVAPKFGLA